MKPSRASNTNELGGAVDKNDQPDPDPGSVAALENLDPNMPQYVSENGGYTSHPGKEILRWLTPVPPERPLPPRSSGSSLDKQEQLKENTAE